VGLAVNGRKSAFPKTEYKAGICINNSSSIAIEDCDLYECKGDGLICYAQSEGDRNRFVTVTNTICRDNFRLGCAISDLTVGRFVDCRFTGSLGTSPMAGLDIEPNLESAWINDIEFHRCRFSGNGSNTSDDGSGVTVNLHENPTNTQEGISFYDCTIRKNRIMGVILYHGRDVAFQNCEITSNGKSGIAILETSDNIRIEGGTIARNQAEGITAIRETDQVLTNLQVRNVTIENNSRSSPKDFDGIKLEGSCHDISIVDNVVTGSHRYGVWIADSVTNVELTNNDLAGNGVGPAYPASLVEDSSEATPASLLAFN
jgi:parallel beta-helix repeat protein